MNINGRPTNDPKPNQIVVRLNDKMNNYIGKMSDKRKESKSDYIRNLISDDMERAK